MMPSIWPVALSAGVTLLAFGVVTSSVFSLVGAVLFAWSLAGWIRDLRHETHQEHVEHVQHVQHPRS